MNEVNLSLCAYIIDRLNDLPKTSPVPKVLLLYLKKKQLENEMLDICLEKDILYLGEKKIVFANRRKMLKLFEAFLRRDNHEVSRSELVELVYLERDPLKVSERQLECLEHNCYTICSVIL